MAQNNSVYPFKQNGYIYGPGTAKGFLRMQRQGIPRPVFAIENKLKNLLKIRYQKMVRELMQDFKRQARAAGISAAQLTQDSPEDDSLDSLVKFFEEMGRQEEEARKAQEEANLKAQLQSTAANLTSEWFQEEEQQDPDAIFTEKLLKIFKANQEDYSARLESDAGPAMAQLLKPFKLDKKKVYDANMEGIRRLYLDNALARIHGEETELKHKFIQQIEKYITGETDTLDVWAITETLLTRTSHMAQFFARDQLARFNKATTLATFETADVTKVKWVTSHDKRVRQTHKDLDGQVFPINALPPEVDDYNCRCGLVPVEWAD